MPKPMTEDKQKIIINALDKGLSRSQIATVVGVSKRAITRINTNLKKHGSAKPPPSGLKLGRPVRLTNRQIRAMMEWMKEREHTFYVKDLVQYLRETHGYEGCDGTVRRGLLRSGFRKKLPWHKSEVTAWLPPEDGDVVMAFAADDDDDDTGENGENGDNDDELEDGVDSGTPQASRVNGAAVNAPSSRVVDPVSDQQDTTPAPNIDPRLDLEQHVAAALSQMPNSMPHANNAPQQAQQAVTSTSLPGEPSRTQEALESRRSTVAQQSPPNRRSPTKTARRKTPAAKQNNASAASTSTDTATGQTALETQLSAMQSQLAQQQDTIAKLQQQLAAAQQASSAPPTPAAPIAQMGTYRQARGDDKSPIGQRENGGSSPHSHRGQDIEQTEPSPEQSYEIQYEV